MAIREDKERITVTINKDLKKKLIEYAEIDRRTPSNEFAFILEEYIKSREVEK